MLLFLCVIKLPKMLYPNKSPLTSISHLAVLYFYAKYFLKVLMSECIEFFTYLVITVFFSLKKVCILLFPPFLKEVI